MTFELRIFGAPIEFGSFGFFDLMDSAPAATPARADVLEFNSKTVEAPTAFQEAALPTAA